MAYAVEKETEFGMIPKNDHGEYIKVVRVEAKSGSAIDIRNYFTNAEGKVCPTQKGVRIRDEQIVAVLIALLDAATPEEFNEAVEHFNEGEVEA